MRFIPEIVRLLEQFREHRIETVDAAFRSRRADKAYRLYDGLRKGELGSDALAAKTLYGSDPTDTRYSTLKSRLRKRIINSLFHLNLKRAGFSEYAQALYSCNRRLFLTNTLISLGARNSGAYIARRTLVIAQKYDFTNITVNIAPILRYHSSVIGKAAEYERYNGILKGSLRTLEAELRSAEYFERSQAITSSVSVATPEFIGQLKEYVLELRGSYSEVESLTFITNSLRLRIMLSKAQKQFGDTIEACDEGLRYLEAHPHFISNARLGEFWTIKLECYTILRDFENGLRAADVCLQFSKEGSNPWFAIMERYMLFLMTTMHFVEADKVFREATEHPRFATLPDTWKERWKIFELYLQFALRSLPEYESLPLRKKFDLQAFLRFIPSAAKDKHGMHVAVLTIHILYLLEAKDFSGIIDRMDALRTYRTRYLRTGANRRSSIFFKLLTVMENNSFSYKLTKQKSERLYKQLLAAGAEEAETNEELQVIPYEWLWERAMEKLKEFETEYSRA